MKGDLAFYGVLALVASGAFSAAGPAHAQEDVSYEYLAFPLTPEVEDFVDSLDGNNAITLLQLYNQLTGNFNECLTEAGMFGECVGEMNVLYLTGYHLSIKNGDGETGTLAEMNRLSFLYSLCIEEQQDLGACENVKLAFDGVVRLLND